MKALTPKQYVITFLLLSPIFALAFTIINKSYWDREVGKMCVNEGGTKIFETVEIVLSENPNIKFARNGTLSIPFEILAAPTDRYVIRSVSTVLYSRGPVVKKFETFIVDREQDKTLSYSISFERGGGDFPFSNLVESGFSCRDIPGFSANPLYDVFVIVGE